MGELPSSILREPRTRDGPRVTRFLARDDPNPDPKRRRVRRGRRLVLGDGFGVAHRQRTQLPSRGEPRLRRPRHEHAGKELRLERGRHLDVRDSVVPPVERHRPRPPQQVHNELRVFDQARIPLVMRRRVVQRLEVVLEASRYHVEVNASPVQKAQRGDGLRHRVGMHVDGLHGDEGTEPFRVRDHRLRDQPRVYEPVVGIDQDAFAPGRLAPASHLQHLPKVDLG